jgi:hypothetical protein
MPVIGHMINNLINGVPAWYGLGRVVAMQAAGVVISFGIGAVLVSMVPVGILPGMAYGAILHLVINLVSIIAYLYDNQ